MADPPRWAEHAGGGGGVIEHEASPVDPTPGWVWQDPPGRWLRFTSGVGWVVADPGETPPGV